MKHKLYSAEFDFSYEGIIGRYTIKFPCLDEGQAIMIAWRKFEEHMIENGGEPWDCGCCFNEHSDPRFVFRGWDMIASEAINAENI